MKRSWEAGVLAVLMASGMLCACSVAKNVSIIDESVLAYIEEKDSEAYADALAYIESVDESREEEIKMSEAASESERASSIAESIYESMSIEESIREESIEQSRQEAAEESIRESSILSSEEESKRAESESIRLSEEAESREKELLEKASIEASIAASIAAESEMVANGTYGNLIPNKVVLNATMSDVAIIRKLFANTVVIGDSRAKGVVDLGILSENEVSYYGGASVGTLVNTTIAGAQRMKKKALFIVGLNDMGFYHEDAQAFKSALITLIDIYKSVNPNSQIYLQEILPVYEEGRAYWPHMDAYPAFNNAVKEVAAEYGYTFVSANEYATKDMIYSMDFAHYSPTFYLRWAQTIACQMGLWEEIL